MSSDEISATEALLNDLSNISESDQLIPDMSRFHEVSTDNTDDSQIAENSGEEHTHTLIAATEDDSNSIAAVYNDVLGTAEVQEMAQMGTLVTKKQAGILSTDSQEDVELEIEDSDILSEASLNQIIFDNNRRSGGDHIRTGRIDLFDRKGSPTLEKSPKERSQPLKSAIAVRTW